MRARRGGYPCRRPLKARHQLRGRRRATRLTDRVEVLEEFLACGLGQKRVLPRTGRTDPGESRGHSQRDVWSLRSTSSSCRRGVTWSESGDETGDGLSLFKLERLVVGGGDEDVGCGQREGRSREDHPEWLEPARRPRAVELRRVVEGKAGAGVVSGGHVRRKEDERPAVPSADLNRSGVGSSSRSGIDNAGESAGDGPPVGQECNIDAPTQPGPGLICG